MSHEQLIQAVDIRKSYGPQEVLHGVDLGINTGELTLITGPSGSGKTTFLNILSGIEPPDCGSVLHDDRDIVTYGETALNQWRGENVGYMFQRPGLLNMTVKQNIASPYILRGGQIDAETATWANELCGRLRINDLLSRQASGLSGGQQQRVALARALLHRPNLLVADEPTGSVDGSNKIEIHQLLRGLVDHMGVTVVMVSHDDLSADYADRIAIVQDGQVVATN